MRIAICGTHGTGKTTLARALSERFGAPMIHEVARHVIKVFGYENTREYIEKSDRNEKEFIQIDIFKKQKTWEMDYESFIADRSVFDAVAYTKAYGVDAITVNWLLGQAIGHALNIYDLIVYIPPMFDVVDDGFRDMDEGLRWDVDFYLRGYIEAYEVLGGVVLKIESENLEDRIEDVISAVKGLKAIHDAS